MSFPNAMTPWRRSVQGFGSQKYKGPSAYSTPFSSTSNGMTTIDPTIRQSQNTALDTYLGQNADLRSRYLGNQSAFRQARIDPLQRQFATGRAQLQQSLGNRMVSGSSFGDQALQGYDETSQKAIGEAGAQAENEDLQALSQLDQNSLNATLQVRNQQYAQELQELGLGAQQIQQMVDEFENSQRRKLQQLGVQNQTLNTFHSLVTDWGDFNPKKSGIGGGGSPSA